MSLRAMQTNSFAMLPVLLVSLIPFVSGAPLTHAAATTASGAGLEPVQTVGAAASFTITSRDATGVSRTSGGDRFWVELIGPSHVDSTVLDELDGTYSVSYAATRSGEYSLETSLFREGGLAAEYYENVWFFYSPVERRVDSSINFDWGSERVTAQAYDFVSVRWKGKVRADITEVVTFHARADESVRLFVQGVKLVDCWEKNSCKPAAPNPQTSPDKPTNLRGGSGTVSVVAGQLYDIRVEYRKDDGPAAVQLLWSSRGMPDEQVIGGSNLLYSLPVQAATAHVTFTTGVTSGNGSLVTGEGLSLATAGAEGAVRITVRDRYGNTQEQLSGGAGLSVRAYGGGGGRGAAGCVEGGCGGRGRARHGTVVDLEDGEYGATVRSEDAGAGEVLVDVMHPGGLTATYYGGEFVRGLVTEGAAGVGWSDRRAHGAMGALDVGVNETFAVRWRGFVAPRVGGLTTFRFGASSEDLSHGRVRMWVDNTAVIDQWSSIASFTPEGTLLLHRGSYYDVWAEYKTIDTNYSNHSMVLSWLEGSQAAVTVPTTNLFQADPVSGSPFALSIRNAAVCASMSYLSSSDLVAGRLHDATAGRQSSFSVMARDAFGNLVTDAPARPSLGKGLEMLLTGAGAGRGQVQSESGGVYGVTFTATRSGSYAVRVTFDGNQISGSAFELHVGHAQRHVPSSVGQGDGLSLITAGQTASFRILVRDRHGNACYDDRIAEAGVHLAVTDSMGAETVIAPSLFRPLYLVTAGTPSQDAAVEVRYAVTTAGEFSLRVVASGGLHVGAISGSPFQLTVHPQPPCASASILSSSSVTALTAGVAAQFQLHSKDQYFNSIDPALVPASDHRVFTVRVRQNHHTGAPSVGGCFASGLTQIEGRDRVGSTINRGAGLVQGEVVATQGGDNCLFATLAQPGGLQATYYLNDVTFSVTSSADRVAGSAASVDFSVSAAGGGLGGGSVSALGMFSARWTGLVLPSQTGEHTFYLGSAAGSSGGGERVKLWVDNHLVVQQWTSLDISTDAPSGTISLESGVLYEVMAEAKGSNGSVVQLQWASNSTNASRTISSTRLYQSLHICNSPFAVSVSPARVCAATSSVFGSAVTIATAGFPAVFTVQTRDKYSNDRDSSLPTDTLLQLAVAASLSLPSSAHDSLNDAAAVETVGSAQYTSQGRFTVSMTPLSHGRKFLRGRLLSPGGLYGTYFENSDLTDLSIAPDGSSATASYERIDATVDFLWGLGVRPIGEPSVIGKDIGPDYFSVRWRGLVKPTVSEVHTFSVASAGGEVKLYVNDLMILTSLAAIVEEPAGTIALIADTLYPITLEFKRTRSPNPSQRLSLSWRARNVDQSIIPSPNLFTWTTSLALSTSGLPLFVNSGPTCATTSTVNRTQTLATAGQALTFTIQGRDAFGNLAAGTYPGLPPFHVSKGSTVAEGYIASASSASEIQLAATASDSVEAYIGYHIYLHTTGEDREIVGHSSARVVTLSAPLFSLPNFPDTDRYTVYSNATADGAGLDFGVGRPDVVVRAVPMENNGALTTIGVARSGSAVYSGGLTATYYASSTSFGSVLFGTDCADAGHACHETIDFSVSAADSKVVTGGVGSRSGGATLSLGNTEYAVRWAGFLRATTSGSYLFSTELMGYNGSSAVVESERVRLWIDGRVVIDQWSSLSSGVPQGSFAMAGPETSYQIRISYKQTALNTSSGLRIKWNRQDTNSNTTSSSIIASSQLYPMDGTLLATAVVTVPGEYQTQISLAHGGGLFATYYSNTAGAVPSWSGTESSVKSLGTQSSTRWLAATWHGMLRFGGGATTSTDGTDVTVGVEVRGADERVRLEIDGDVSLEWTGTGPYQDVSAGAQAAGPNGGVVLSGSNLLQLGRYYEVKLSYWVGEQGRPLIRFWCSGGGIRSLCDPDGTIHLTSLYTALPIAPTESSHLTVVPSAACAAVSTTQVQGTSVATAGGSIDISVISRDEFGNKVEGGDAWVTRMVSYAAWDAMEPYATPRLSRDCHNCGGSSTYELLAGGDNSSYAGTVVNTGRGVIKVLSELLTPAGLQATYYDVLSTGANGSPMFHRTNQRMDSLSDFPTPCITRLSDDGWSSESRVCSGWVSGAIRGGNQTRIDFDSDGWVIEEAWAANASDWRVLITAGECAGQSRKVASLIQTDTTSSALVSSAWTTTNGNGSEGVLLDDGTGLESEWDGCQGPSAGGRFVLWNVARPPGSLPNNAFGVRWTGFISPSFSSPYTFSATLSSDTANQERLKLWIDSKIVIDQWTSLASVAPSAVSALSSPTSAYHHIQLEYKRGAAGPAPPLIRFQWENTLAGTEANPAQLIPSSKLYGAANIPPENSESSEIDVVPAGTSGQTSVALGNAITETTAGVTSYFTIRAKDEYGNSRNEDAWHVLLTPHGAGPDVRGLVSSSQSSPGDYLVSYTATQSGSYTLDVRRGTVGGLNASYFNNVHQHGSIVLTHIAAQIEYEWGSGVVSEPGGCNESTQQLLSEGESSCLTGRDFVSATWTGLFRAEFSEAYTFTVDADDAATLTINGVFASVGCTTGNYMACSSSSGSGSLSVSFAAIAGQLYEVDLTYKEFTGNASLFLSYASASVVTAIVPSSRLYHSAEHVFGSPFSLTVQPAEVNRHETMLTGLGISAATAGLSSAFTIIPRDEYGNPSTSTAGIFNAFVSNQSPTVRSIQGTISSLVKLDQYKAQYTEVVAGVSDVHVLLLSDRGVFATYYDTEAGSEPVKARQEDVISLGSSDGGLGVPASVGEYAFSVRWRGMLRPSTAGEYSFYAVNTPQNSSMVSERVRLWIDGALLIDQWTSLAQNSLSSGTIGLQANPNYYEILVDYKAPDRSSAVSIDVASGGANRSLLSSTNLFLPLYIPAEEILPVTVQPAPTDLTSTSVVGIGLTIATAGITSSFTIACFDAFSNSRADADGNSGCSSTLRVDAVLHDTNGGDVLNTTMQEIGGVNIEVTFIPEMVGTYQTMVSVGTGIREYDVFVHPGLASSQPTQAAGMALTVATAGFTATFTIQSKDAYANLRCIGGDDFRVWIRGVGDERHDAAATYIGTAPATDLGRYVVAYRPTRSGDYRLGIQLASETRGLVRMTCYLDNALQIEQRVANESQISIDWGEEGCGETGPLDGFSVRWDGWVEGGFSELYTFDVSLGGTDERVRLWVEDSWVLDEWSSLSASNPSCTLFLSANALTDISMEYKDVQGSSKAILRWQSASQTRQIIPSTNLFGIGSGSDLHIQGSPFSLSVYPAMTSGSVTSAVGMALSLATAGTSSAFTIQARDHLGNRKTNGGDRFDVRVRHNADYTRQDILGTVTQLGNGEYRAEYIPTWKRRGQGGVDAPGSEDDFHQVVAQITETGGLMATYYNDATFVNPSRTKLLSSVAVPVPDAAAALSSVCVDEVGDFAVRFSGLIDPPGQQLYTFKTVLSGAEERVRVWVDNSLLIDQWNSLDGAGGVGTVPTGTFYLQERGDLLALDIEYRIQNSSSPPNSSLDLQWQYSGSSFSTVSGDVLLHGHALTFMVGGNERGLAATYYSPPPSSTAELGGDNAQLSVTAESLDWSGSGSDVRPHPHSLSAGQAFAARWVGFLRTSQPTWGTYTFQAVLGGGADTSERVRIWIDNQQIVDQWSSVDSVSPSGSIRLPPDQALFNLRVEYKLEDGIQTDRGWRLEWKGREVSSTLPDFGDYSIADPSVQERSEAWTVRGDQTDSFAVVPRGRLVETRTATVIGRDDFAAWDVDYYDPTQTWYEDREAGTSGQWGKTGGCAASLGSDGGGRYLLCRGKGIRENDVLRVEVMAGKVCGSQVMSSGNALTIATAGVQRQFFVTARDAYQNQRDGDDDSFLARASLAAPRQPETMIRASFTGIGGESEGLYAGDYVTTVSGRYDLSVETLDIRGNGLFGSYYAGSVPFSGENDVRVDPNIEFEWGREGPTWRIPRGSAFSVRWTGWIKADVTALHRFYAKIDGRIRLYIDDHLVIEYWGPDEASAGSDWVGDYFMERGTGYRIRMDYWHASGLAFATLSWRQGEGAQIEKIPSRNFFPATQVIQNGVTALFTHPSTAHGPAMIVQGSGLSVTTAGVASSFFITVRDEYENKRDDPHDILLARIIPDVCSGPVPPASLPAVLRHPPQNVSSDIGTVTSGTLRDGIAKAVATVSDGSSSSFGWQTGNVHPFAYRTTRAGASLLYTDLVPRDATAAGTVREVQVESGGAGYSSDVALSVFCSGSCTGTGLAGTCTVFNGTVIAVTLSNAGQGYTPADPPTVACSGGGTNATLTVLVGWESEYHAVGSGLQATYYASVSGSAGTVWGNGNIDFSESGLMAPVAGLDDDGEFRVRWQGLMRAPRGGGFRLYAAMTQTDERVKLWVDTALVIDQWHSLSSLSISAAEGAALAVGSSPGQLVDLTVEYSKGGGQSHVALRDSGLSLKRADSGGSVNEAAVVQRTDLFEAAGPAPSPFGIDVKANIACSTQSELYGTGLSLATVGENAQFTIHLRDEYANSRLVGSDEIVVRAFSDQCQTPPADPNSPLNPARCQPYPPQTGSDGANSLGRTTTGGEYLLRAGGAVFSGSDISGCALGSDGALVLNSAGAVGTSSVDGFYVSDYAIFVDGACSGRWSTIASYNGSTQCANLTVSSGLWTDGQAPCSSASNHTLYIVNGGLVDATEIFPPMSCPNCQSSTRALLNDRGDGTYLSTMILTGRGQHSVFASISPGQGLTATYYDSHTALSRDLGTGNPVSVRIDGGDGSDFGVDWSANNNGPIPVTSLAGNSTGFAVRWAGFVRPSRGGVYTFHVPLGGDDGTAVTDRLKLWIDNQLIIGQWSSLVSAAPSGTISIPNSGQLYDVGILYQCPAGNVTCGYKLEWENTAPLVPCDRTERDRIPGTRLRQRADIPNALGQLRAVAGVPCAALSFATASPLSIATAGVAASFTIQARDAYGNAAEVSVDYYIQLRGIDGQPIYSGSSAALDPAQGTSLGSYTAFVAKEYEMTVQGDTLDVRGSPFTVTVLPNLLCGSQSSLSGSGLTAATVSPSTAQFTIDARDEYGNARSDAQTELGQFFVRVVRTEVEGEQGDRGVPPFYGASALSDAGDIPTLHATITSTTGGSLAASYTVPSIPSPAGQAHYLHGGWLVGGGVYATYYSSSASITDALPAPCVTCDNALKLTANISTSPSSSLPSDIDSALVGSSSICGSSSCNLVIRWQGAVQACPPSTLCQGGPDYTRDFKWTIANTDRVKLWLDNKLIIDQWTSLHSAAPSAPATFGAYDRILDVFAEYQRLSSDTSSTSPVTLLDTGSTDGSFQSIESSRLYTTEPLLNTPYRVNILA